MKRLSRTDSRAQTRQRLMHAARREFALRGVRAASIDRISENAGYSRGAFYANFAGKHDLLLELLQQHQTREIEVWQSLLDAVGPLSEVLPALRQRFDQFARDADEVLFSAELQIEAMRNPEFSERYRAFAAEISRRVRRMADAFIARAGGSRVSSELLAVAIESFSRQLIAEARLGTGAAGASAGDRLVRLIAELLGVSADDSRKGNEPRREEQPS